MNSVLWGIDGDERIAKSKAVDTAATLVMDLTDEKDVRAVLAGRSKTMSEITIDPRIAEAGFCRPARSEDRRGVGCEIPGFVGAGVATGYALSVGLVRARTECANAACDHTISDH